MARAVTVALRGSLTIKLFKAVPRALKVSLLIIYAMKMSKYRDNHVFVDLDAGENLRKRSMEHDKASPIAGRTSEVLIASMIEPNMMGMSGVEGMFEECSLSEPTELERGCSLYVQPLRLNLAATHTRLRFLQTDTWLCHLA